mgnify:CR=1 FL=1|jgi:hypothetical protein
MAKLSDFGYSVDDSKETRQEAIKKMVDAGIGEGLYKTLIYRMNDARKAPKPAFNASTKYTVWADKFKTDAAYVKKLMAEHKKQNKKA